MPAQTHAPKSPAQEPNASVAPLSDGVAEQSELHGVSDLELVAAGAARQLVESNSAAPTPHTPVPRAAAVNTVPESSGAGTTGQEAAPPLHPIAELAQKVRLLHAKSEINARTDPNRDQLIAKESQPKGVKPNDYERANGIITSNHVARALHELLHRDYVSMLSGTARAEAEKAISPDNLLVFLEPTLESLEQAGLDEAERVDKTSPQWAAGMQLYDDAHRLLGTLRRERPELHAISADYKQRRYRPTFEITKKFIYSYLYKN